MTETTAPSRPGIGAGSSPLFAVLPNPQELFAKRAARLEMLAPGHTAGSYLNFAAKVAKAQRRTAESIPAPAHPGRDRLEQAFQHGMPPIAKADFAAFREAERTLLAFLAELSEEAVPAEAVEAAASLGEAPAPMLEDALQDKPARSIPQRVLILSAMQVHFSVMAAQLRAADLKPIADGVCPACGSPPMVSSVVGWRGAHSARFCTCSLCGTMWNAVRVKCVLCSSTEGIGYLSIEGKPESVKAETCEKCRSYLKILYQVKDHLLEPCADDVASLELDMMLAQEGWRRGGHNPFLLGY